MTDLAAFRARRARVMDQMAAAGGGVALLASGVAPMRSRDTEYPFRSDSYFHYLTGFPEPEALLVLQVDGQARHTLLFCRPRDEAREIWDGLRVGPAGAQAGFGLDEAQSIETLDTRLPELLADAPAVFLPLGHDAPLEAQLARWLAAVRARTRQGITAPAALHDIWPWLDEMRLVKDAAELSIMRRAAAITAGAHRRAMQRCRPGWQELHLEAELLHEFRRHGAQAPAYPSIVAAGANACVLHYAAGDTELRAGELCLIDAGCELDGYASDVTRTFPVSGRFSAEQRAVYTIVQAAQQAAIEAVRAGRSFHAPHEAALRVLTQGLIDLGVVTGSLDGALESGAYKPYYMHKTSHWLGRDVHDVGDYRAPGTRAAAGTERPWRTLAPDMVLTIEPGLYLRPSAAVPPALHHIGIRIEDDVRVTTADPEVLSAAAPKHIDEIEALMARSA
jgi:Xaa-Pro aminopeptidase